MTQSTEIHEPDRIATVFTETTHGDALIAALAHHSVELGRQSRMLYDFSRPVDEYQSTQGWPANGYMEIQATYEMPERITGIHAVIPIGVTWAQLQLGDRWLTLYQGAALTASLTCHFSDCGFILGRDDMRALQLYPQAQPAAATGGVHLELTGFADETWGMA